MAYATCTVIVCVPFTTTIVMMLLFKYSHNYDKLIFSLLRFLVGESIIASSMFALVTPTG